MADRQVTHVFRDSDGLTLSIANPGEPWFQRRAEWAVADIVRGRHRYFVPGAGGGRPIHVVDGPTGPYLRSGPDDSGDNNLDALLFHDRSPWEVAHDHSEVLAVHVALIGHGAAGQVLLLGGNEHDQANSNSGETDNTRIYDIATNAMLHVDSPQADAFCCGHAFLPDGRFFVGGGTAGWRQWEVRAAMLPDPNAGADSGGGRWYPTLVTLADGRILAVGGHPSTNDSRHGAWLPELYDPPTDSWSYIDGHWPYVNWGDVNENEVRPAGQEDAETNNYQYYPRMFVVPGGRVFLASPTDDACGWYDPATGLIDTATIEPPPHGGDPYAETNHTAVLLPLLPGDGYTARVLFLGMDGPHRITLGTADPDQLPAWEPAAPRDWPVTAPLRRHGCATLLPTGEVFFAGGIDNDGGSGLPDSDAVLEGEIYQPGIDWPAGVYDQSLERWTTTPPATVARNYHSVAILLPNGLVLTAGSNLDGQDGGDAVKEYRIEMFSPAYDGDTLRPEIADAPSQLTYGEEFSIVTTRADLIQRVALLRCGSVTHAWDGDQRYVGLEFAVTAPGVIEATAPPDGAVAPPGPYLLWVVDDGDRPCRLARFVLLS